MNQKRPRLVHVAPFTYWICVGYAAVDIIFAAGLLSYHPVVPYVIVGQHIFTLQWWGAIFGVLGIAGFIALMANSWRWIRALLALGLVTKSLWFFALLIRTADGGALVTLAMWTFLAYAQLLTVIFFPDEIIKQ
jgi:hypothetical protein